MREFEGSLTKRLIGHSGPVYSCKFMHPDGDRMLISVSQDGTARLWSLDLFSCLAVFRGHSQPVWDVDVAPLGAGPYFATASADRTARLWSVEHIQALRIFVGHLSDVNVVRFHPNGNYVITGSADKTCRMWDIQSGKCVRLFSSHSRAVSALAVSPDGRFLASGDYAGQIQVWDLAEGRLIKTVQPLSRASSAVNGTTNAATSNTASIYSLDFDRDGRLLAAAGADQIVRLWDVNKLLQNANPSLLTPTNSSSTPNALPEDGLLSSYPTKSTPIMRLNFTYRNILLAAGPFSPFEDQSV